MSGPPLTNMPERKRGKRSHPKFVLEGPGVSDGENEALRTSDDRVHTRTASNNTTSYSFLDTPPATPRHHAFSSGARPSSSYGSNPFSSSRDPTPPAGGGDAPGSAGLHPPPGSGWPFPDVSNSNSSAGGSHNHNNNHSSSRPGSAPGHFQVYHTISPSQSRSSLGSRPGTAGDGTGNGSSRPLSMRSREAFASPRPRPLTVYSTIQPSVTKVQRERMKSTMLQDVSNIPKPWLKEKDPYMRVAYWLTYGVMFFGIGLGAIRCYFGWVGVPTLEGNLCPVLDENFDSEDGLFGDNGKFFREVDMSGFGNGDFSMATDFSNNSYVKNGFLYLTPTLTADAIGEAALIDNYTYTIPGCTYNITQGVSYTQSSKSQPLNASAIAPDTGFDSAAYMRACMATSNVTSGQIVNPVQSARLSTRKTASIKYGKVEVRAKIPSGDWLWPAIWMLPVENTYGAWPISGEIDIMEARGNGPSYPKQGSDFVRGSLNWGPTTWLNAVFRTFGWWKLRRGSWADDFHTYSLEWDENFMRIYVDSRLHHLLDLKINMPFFERGDFPHVVQNGTQATILTNPWESGAKSAPFDQPFYLILNIAVGGTNGWFPDGPEKPWLDGSQTPMLDFWRAKDKWLPTWGTDPASRSMVVDYVKMWQLC